MCLKTASTIHCDYSLPFSDMGRGWVVPLGIAIRIRRRCRYRLSVYNSMFITRWRDCSSSWIAPGPTVSFWPPPMPSHCAGCMARLTVYNARIGNSSFKSLSNPKRTKWIGSRRLWTSCNWPIQSVRVNWKNRLGRKLLNQKSSNSMFSDESQKLNCPRRVHKQINCTSALDSWRMSWNGLLARTKHWWLVWRSRMSSKVNMFKVRYTSIS